MFCSNCGKPVPDAARFCPNCACEVRRPAAMSPVEASKDAPAAGGPSPVPGASAQAAAEALAATRRAAQAIAADAAQAAGRAAEAATQASAQAAAGEAQAPHDGRRIARMVLLGADIVLFAFVPWFSFSGFYSFNLFGLGDALSRVAGTASSLGGANSFSTNMSMYGAIAVLAGLCAIGLLAFDLVQEIRRRRATPFTGIVAVLIVLCAAAGAMTVNGKSNDVLSSFSISYDVVRFQMGWYLAFAASVALIFLRPRAKAEAAE